MSKELDNWLRAWRGLLALGIRMDLDLREGYHSLAFLIFTPVYQPPEWDHGQVLA